MASVFLLLSLYRLINNVAVARPEKGCERLINPTADGFGETNIALTSGYPINFDCIWRVISSLDYMIMLEIQEVETYNQMLGNCSDDYVQVTGKMEGEDELIKTCLTENMSSLYYYSPVTIEFHSDNNSDSGITFSIVARWVEFLRGYRGRIESPGFPNNYPMHASRVWIIEAPIGFRIQITFDVFVLEDAPIFHCWDYVKIIDPENTDVGPNEKRYCGKSLAQSTKTSRGRRMEILFHSDNIIARQGFTASWITVCQYEFINDSGELIVPNNSSGYPENQNCTWNIVVQNGYKLLLTLNVTCSNDWNISTLACIQLIEWKNETALVKGKFCCGSFTFEFYNSTAVSFLSDNDSSTVMSFSASWTSSLVKFRPGYIGRFESPGYPNDYPNNVSETWIIEAPVGFQIQITFVVFMLQDRNWKDLQCFDYVKIIQPESTDVAANKEQYCGTALAESSMTSTGRKVEILFHSDNSVVRQGFSASWVTVCGGELNSSFGELIGPNSTSGYPENQNCTWTIKVQNGYRLLLTINVTGYNDWNNSSLDYIQVTEWQNETAFVKGHVYSSNVTFEFYNSLAISFLSDNDSSTGLSFNASWVSECRKIYSANNGEIQSPDYPVDYDAEIRCIWTIEVSSGHAVILNYTLPKTSEDKDPCNPYVLQVTEAVSSAQKILCKTNDFNIHRSGSNTLIILFIHEPGTKYTKFFAIWRAEEANRTTDASEGDNIIPDEILDMKHAKCSYSVAAVSLQAAVGPLALVIFMIILLLILKGRSVWSFRMQMRKLTQNTNETGFETVNPTDTGNLEQTVRFNPNFSQRIGFQTNTFRPKLPTPPMRRLCFTSAGVWEGMGFEDNEYDFVNVDRTEELCLSIIGKRSMYAECKEVAGNVDQDEFISKNGSGVDGIVCTIGKDFVRDKLKCPGRLCESALADTDCTNNTLQNEGYITSITLDSSSRTSSSDLDASYFQLEVDVHHKLDD